MAKITEEELLGLIPELNEIENAVWRKASIQVWLRAAEECSWPDISVAPNNTDNPEDPLICHTRSVLRCAEALAKTLRETRGFETDPDKLRVVCLLHDVCKLSEMEPDGNGGVQKSLRGKRFSHGFLSGWYCLEQGLPEDIVAAITDHSQFVKNLPDIPEGFIQFYADMADADSVRHKTGKTLLMQYCKI